MYEESEVCFILDRSHKRDGNVQKVLMGNAGCAFPIIKPHTKIYNQKQQIILP